MNTKCKKMLSSLLCFLMLPNLLGSSNCFYAQEPFYEKSFVDFNESAGDRQAIKEQNDFFTNGQTKS